MLTMIAAGRVGGDGELRQTQSGTDVLGFSIAVDNGKDQNGNKLDPTWVRCTIWGNRAKALGEKRIITKGMSLTVTGRPKATSYKDKGTLELSVDNLTFQSGSNGPSNEQGDNRGFSVDQSKMGDAAPNYGAGDMDDEIPF